jgi:DUF4097 and DUF4098 domain-containing protein YvlB
MNKKTIITLVLIFLAVFIVFGVISSLAFTKYFKNIDNIEFNADGRSFDINENKSLDIKGIDVIEIDVVSSDIDIVNGDDKLNVNLRSRGVAAGEKVKLVTEKLGNTLLVKVEYPRVAINMSSSKLNIELPESFDGSLIINSTSGDLSSKEVLKNTLKKLEAKSVSGDVVFNTNSIEDVKLKSTSSDFDIISDISSLLKAESTSGDIDINKINNSDANVYAKSVSGSIVINYIDACETEIKTTSGDVDISIINNNQIDLDFKSTSGDMNGNVSINSNGTPFKISTVSGDLSFD